MNWEPVFFKDRAAWRGWLERNHDKATEIWILAYKVHTGRKSVSYLDALEEALCFGWIDSRMRRIDDEKHAWRFAPRKPNSVWSLSNRGRVGKLMREGRMRPHGLATVAAAKRSGQWDKAIAPSRPPRMPRELKQALMKNKEAWKNFQAFAKSYRTTYIYWISSAKRDETRKKRIGAVVERAAKNLKMYMPEND
jgi:uncharacterized protein YdeI (YjbR/CyaY-like superfamily)